MSAKVSQLDKFQASDFLVIYQRNGAVKRGTVASLTDYIESNIQVSGTITETYDPNSYTEDTDASYIYWAWARIDGTGYLAKRRSFATPDVAESNTGSLPIPPDLTVLIYS